MIILKMVLNTMTQSFHNEQNNIFMTLLQSAVNNSSNTIFKKKCIKINQQS